MNLISKQFKTNSRVIDITTSIVFYLYSKNQYKYTKSVNSIKASYLDPILKDKIYVASNGLKKDIFFRRPECNENILTTDTNCFVSYFYALEDNLFKFNIYPYRYFKNLTISYLKKQQILLKVKNKLTTVEKVKYKSRFVKNFALFSNLKKDPICGNFSKIIYVKALYLKLYVLTNNGFVKNLSNRYSDRALFAGLQYIFKEFIKETFRNILILNYVLLNFFSSIILTFQKNKNLLYNIVIYYNLWKFLNLKFLDFLKEKNLRFRKSNVFLRKYTNLHSYRIKKIIKLYYFLALKHFKYNLNTNNWIRSLTFNTNNIIFNSSTDEVENNRLLNTINSLSLEDRFLSFKYIFNYIKYNLGQDVLDHQISLRPIQKYIYLKAIITESLLRTYFPKLIWFFEFNFKSYLYDLFFFKTIAIQNYVYSNESHIFIQKMLHWYTIFKRKNSSFKTMAKRRYNFLVGVNNNKNVRPVIYVNNLKSKKKFNTDVITFITKFSLLKNNQIKKCKIKNIIKAKKSFRYKKFTVAQRIKKVNFINEIINALITLGRRRTLNLPEFNRLRINIK